MTISQREPITGARSSRQLTESILQTQPSSGQHMNSIDSTALCVKTTLRVVEVDIRNDSRWEKFVSGHPSGSIYHHPTWLEALKREYGREGLYLACEDDAGQFLAVLPLSYTRGLPFKLGGGLTGRRLSSLPRTPIAGPLSKDSRATAAIVKATIQFVAQDHTAQVQIKTQGRELDGLVDGLVCTPWRLSYVLRLDNYSNGPFRVADSDNRHSIKKAVNRAIRLGVRIRPAETLSDLREWYVLYLDTMRRNCVPARPFRFFSALWELLRPKGLMKLLLAERQDDRRKRLIAGTIFLQFAQTTTCGFNGSSPADFSLRPNDLIYWEAINEACRRRYRFFDFGEVAEEHPELARYKSKWGSEPVRLYRYYFPAPHDGNARTFDSGGYPGMLLREIWRRLPLRATACLSDRIYSYL